MARGTLSVCRIRFAEHLGIAASKAAAERKEIPRSRREKTQATMLKLMIIKVARELTKKQS